MSLLKGKPTAICLQQDDSAERILKQGFQMKENAQFSRLNGQYRHIKRRSVPLYRHIHIYSKSSKQYRKERQRRRKVLELVNKGCSFGQIVAEFP